MPESPPPPIPPPLPRRKRRWFGLPPVLAAGAAVAIGLVALVFLGFLGLGVAIQLGHVPDTLVLAGDDLPSAARRAVERHAGLEPGEEILFYYSAGLLSHADDGNVVTDRRAISWGAGDDGEVFVADARWEDVEHVEVVIEGSFLEDTVVDLTTTDDRLVQLWLSTEEDGDDRALAEIRRLVADRGAAAER